MFTDWWLILTFFWNSYSLSDKCKKKTLRNQRLMCDDQFSVKYNYLQDETEDKDVAKKTR